MIHYLDEQQQKLIKMTHTCQTLFYHVPVMLQTTNISQQDNLFVILYRSIESSNKLNLEHATELHFLELRFYIFYIYELMLKDKGKKGYRLNSESHLPC